MSGLGRGLCAASLDTDCPRKGFTMTAFADLSAAEQRALAERWAPGPGRRFRAPQTFAAQSRGALTASVGAISNRTLPPPPKGRGLNAALQKPSEGRIRDATPKTVPAPPPVTTGLSKRDLDTAELCAHEAGHAVAAVLLGEEVRSAAIVDSRVLGLHGTTWVAQGLSAHDASIALAGPWAAARFRAGRTPHRHEVQASLNASCGHSGGKSDLALVAAAGGTDAVATDLGPLMDRCWPAIVRVAQKLARTGEALHGDVCAALGLSEDSSRHAFELANIRAGLRAVPA